MEGIRKRLTELDARKPMALDGLTDQKIERFGGALAHMLRNGDIKFRQAYLRLLIEHIDADGSQLRITGSEDVLAAMALNSGKPDRDSVSASVTCGVPTGIRTRRKVWFSPTGWRGRGWGTRIRT